MMFASSVLDLSLSKLSWMSRGSLEELAASVTEVSDLSRVDCDREARRPRNTVMPISFSHDASRLPYTVWTTVALAGEHLRSFDFAAVASGGELLRMKSFGTFGTLATVPLGFGARGPGGLRPLNCAGAATG